MSPESERVWSRRLYLFAAFVVLWRLAAALWPYRDGAMGTMSDETGIRLVLALMGLVFVGCGLLAHHRVPVLSSRIFAFSALAGGLHWGGPIEITDPTMETALVLFYLTASSVLEQAFLLHFALLFTSAWAMASWRTTRVLLYLPTVTAGIASVAITAFPAGGSVSDLSKMVLGLALGLPYAVLALILLLVRSARAGRQNRQSMGLTVMSAGIVIGALPYALITAGVPLPGGDQIYNLFFVLTPLAMTYAICKTGSRAAKDLTEES